MLKCHVDTNNKNYIAWKNPEDLRRKLYSRIRSTILDQG